MFDIYYTQEAKFQLIKLKENNSLKKQYKAVSKCIRFLTDNPRHSGLQTHEYTELTKQFGTKIFEAYAEQHTPGAYRVFWHYGPSEGEITIVAILAHPKY